MKNKKLLYERFKQASQNVMDKSKNLILKNQLTQLTFFVSLIIIILIAIYGIAYLLGQDASGLDYVFAQILYTAVIISIAWIISRSFQLVVKQYYNRKDDSHIPRYVMTLFNWILGTATVLYISVHVFEQDAWKMITAGGIIGAGLAFSLQGIVLDAISGLILDVEQTYKIGDWIRIDDDAIGKVTKTSWRHIQVLTEHCTLITIPNRSLTSSRFENLTHQKKPYAEHFEFSIDHDIPVARAERVMLDGLMTVKEVVKTGIYGIYARGANEGGVTFQIRFGIENYGDIRPIRHKVIRAVLTQLHSSGLKLSETIGEYALSKAKPFEYVPDFPVDLILRRVSLFSALSDDECEQLARKARKVLIDRGDDLIVKDDDTDSLFVIAEGLVDIIVPQKKGRTTQNLVVGTLGSGNFVGDRALLLGEKRSATVRANSPVLAYEITKDHLKPILENRPEIVDDLSVIMAERELDTQQKLKAAAKRPRKKQSLIDSLKESMKAFFNL